MRENPILAFFLVFLSAAAIFAGPETAATGSDNPPAVAATIKPLDGLVAAVMAGAGTPTLLIPGGESPHIHTVRPSEARVIASADLVFWIGPTLESSYAKTLKALARGKVVTMTEVPGIELLAERGAGIARHDHGDDHEVVRAGTDLDPSRVDPHIWLDPVNAKAMVRAIADALAEADPARADLYRSNAAKMDARLDALDSELKSELAGVRDIPFITYHDAYQYFERRYGLDNAGAVALSPEQQPGARHLSDLREVIANEKVVCVFTEPQFRPALAETLVTGTKARIGTLDPESQPAIAAGPDFYFGLMRALAKDLRACLAPSGG